MAMASSGRALRRSEVARKGIFTGAAGTVGLGMEGYWAGIGGYMGERGERGEAGMGDCVRVLAGIDRDAAVEGREARGEGDWGLDRGARLCL
jgi:hypothetical protein